MGKRQTRAVGERREVEGGGGVVWRENKRILCFRIVFKEGLFLPPKGVRAGKSCERESCTYRNKRISLYVMDASRRRGGPAEKRESAVRVIIIISRLLPRN